MRGICGGKDEERKRETESENRLEHVYVWKSSIRHPDSHRKADCITSGIHYQVTGPFTSRHRWQEQVPVGGSRNRLGEGFRWGAAIIADSLSDVQWRESDWRWRRGADSHQDCLPGSVGDEEGGARFPWRVEVQPSPGSFTRGHRTFTNHLSYSYSLVYLLWRALGSFRAESMKVWKLALLCLLVAGASHDVIWVRGSTELSCLNVIIYRQTAIKVIRSVYSWFYPGELIQSI